jgi:hypothetical protein
VTGALVALEVTGWRPATVLGLVDACLLDGTLPRYSIALKAEAVKADIMNLFCDIGRGNGGLYDIRTDKSEVRRPA